MTRLANEGSVLGPSRKFIVIENRCERYCHGQCVRIIQKIPLLFGLCYIGNRQPRGNHAKSRIEGGELAQKRLGRRIT
jgi:hypothetical protein